MFPEIITYNSCRLKRDEWVNTTWHCSTGNLFGMGYEVDMGKQTNPHYLYKGITWDSFTGIVASMKRIEMKIRPKDYDKNGKL